MTDPEPLDVVQDAAPAVVDDAARVPITVGAFIAVACGTIGQIPVVAVAPLVARDMLGSALWSGIPGAVTIAGTALGTSAVARVMARRSRRLGMAGGFTWAALSALMATTAVTLGSFPLFLTAMFLLGGGYGARHLARYVAGEAWPRGRRGSVIGLIVWAGTLGAVAGPFLLAPSQALALRFELVGLAGPYLLCAAACGVAVLALLATIPAERSRGLRGTSVAPGATAMVRLLVAVERRFAVVTMVAGQFVMVLIMAMTPLHIDTAGQGLAAVGVVVGAHTIGMFALSPLTGLLSDRWGRRRVMVVGLVLLVAAALLAATSDGDQRATLVVALFLLGLGWNFGYISSSALLSETDDEDRGLAIQGAADTVSWSTAALASLSAGILVNTVGYRGLCLLGALVALVAMAFSLRDGGARRRR